MNKKFYKQTIIWLILTITIFFIGIVTLTFHYSSVTLQQGLDSLYLPITLIRCSIYVVILLCWPALMRRLALRYQWDDTYLTQVIAQRYRIFIWLIVLELVLAQNIIGRFIGLFF